MQYFLIILLVILVLLSKPTNKVYLLMIMYFVTIFGLNNHHLNYSPYYNMDFENYYTAYLSSQGQISDRNMELGFKYLMYIFNEFNLSFNSFRTFVAILGYSLIIYSLKKYTKYLNLVFLLYFIFPFFNDVIQIRNFLSFSIVIFSIQFLISDHKFGSIKYSFGIFVASLFHVGSIFYLIFILAKYLNLKMISGFIIVLVPGLTLISFTPVIPFLVSRFTENEKLLSYLTEVSTYGNILKIGTLLAYFASLYFIAIFLKRNISLTENGTNFFYYQNKKKFYDFILKINFLLLTIAPLLIFDFNFIRLYRNILIFNYILFVDAIFLSLIIKKRTFEILAIVIIFILYLFILFYLLNSDTQILPVLNDNILF